MADSVRSKIVAAVMARMQTITTGNGYQTDIGDNVNDWRTQYQEDELPAVSVCDLEAASVVPAGASDPQHTIWLMPVQIRIYAKRGATPANIRKMITDVNAAIRTDDRWKVNGVGLVMISRPEREGFLIPDDSFEVIGGVVEFTVQYLTEKFNTERKV